MGWGLDDVGNALKSGASKAAGAAEDVYEDGKRKVGEGVSAGSHAAGDYLRSQGKDGLANWVEDTGDDFASDLGADIPEKELGETDDPNDLLRGNAKVMRETATNLKDFALAFESVGRGMKAVDTQEWGGEAAGAFQKKFDLQPNKWLRAADACEQAGNALEAFAGVVEWAQSQAKEAIEAWRQGERQSGWHKSVVASYKDAEESGDTTGVTKPPETDPGEAGRAAARQLLSTARRQRDEAGVETARLIEVATKHAPSEPPVLSRWKSNASDGLSALEREKLYLAGGALRGAAGMVNTARSVNPLDPYYISRPGEYLPNMQTTVNGVAYSATHPKETAKGMLEALKGNPSEFIGRLAPEALGPKGAGLGRSLLNWSRRGKGGVDLPSTGTDINAAGVRHANDALKDALDRADGTTPDGDANPSSLDNSSDAFDNGGSKGPDDGDSGKDPGGNAPDGNGPEQDANDGRERGEEPGNSQKDPDRCTDGTDPVDLATGKMFLPQTDLALPGALPFAFTRRVESGYKLGCWFGPSWSSTVDQRLLVDSEGVMFVREDGALLSYPHPAPGVPVLPEHGAQWPLDREEGGYTVTDPTTLRVWHFTDHDEHSAVLEQIDDRNGNWITFEHDAVGAPTAIVHSSGYHLRISTDAGRVTALHLKGADADGGDQCVMRYAYEDGNLTEVINSSGLPLKFGYDDRARITSWTDTNNSSYSYEYDDRNRCISEGGIAGHFTLTISYGEADPETGQRTTTTTSAEGRTHRYLINSSDQIVAETDPLGNTVHYERDRLNRVLSRTDPLGRVTRIEYDDSGNPTSIVRPDGRTAKSEYNSLDLPVRVTRFDGTAWRQEYDERGNRTASIDPEGRVTRFVRDEAGRLTSVTDATGATTRIRTNAAGLPAEVTDPLGAVTGYTYDAFGRTVSVTDPLGGTTFLEWSVEGKLLRSTAADGTVESWTYDGEGNCLTHTDAQGGISRFEYTHFDLLTARTGPDGVRYEFAHDSELRLTQVTNPHGLSWNYEFDPAGRLVTETDFDDRVQRYEHDAAGQLAARVNPLGQRITFDRNTLGQVLRKDADGKVTTYAYDFTDQLAEATNPDTRLSILRDRHGRVATEKVADRELRYHYDEFGRRNGRTTPAGAHSTWTYDATGRRAELTTSGHRLQFSRDAAGREISRLIDGTLALDHAYDVMGRRTAQRVATAGGIQQQRDYHYRADGNLIRIDDTRTGTRSFDLDAKGRVTAVHARGWSETYAYDAAGNQAFAQWPDTHPSGEARGERAYEGTRITRAGRIRYEYDDAGRTTLRQKTRLSKKPDTWRYTWDAEDRMISVVTPDGTVWRYEYDALVRRTAKLRMADDGETVVERVDFTWDGATLCEQTTFCPEIPHPVTLTWDHDGHRPLTQTETLNHGHGSVADASQDEINRRFYAITTDLVGTPTELRDPHGNLAWHTQTTLWGATTWNTDAETYTPLRFPGQYFDPETGLHQNYFRTYDPERACYTSQDPLKLSPGPNPSSYAANPQNASDPLGLLPCEIEASKSSTEHRNSPGVATGGHSLPEAGESWLRGSEGNAGRIPGQVAQALEGREFRDFGHFREEFWREVSKHPDLTEGFSPSNQSLMRDGKSPFVVDAQATPGQYKYILHHVQPIQRGGGVYDLDNLLIVTPRYHGEVLDPSYHY